MKISDVIEICQIPDTTFIPVPAGYSKRNRLTIYPTRQGVCYWEDASVWFLTIDENCKGLVYKIKHELISLQPSLYNKERELNRYLAVAELLLAANKVHNSNKQIGIDLIRSYVEKLDAKIYNSLDFRKVEGMDTLIEIISNNETYKEMMFCVHNIQSPKKYEYIGAPKKAESFSFGNVLYHEELDVVNIRTYDDFVEVNCKMEGRTISRELNKNQSYSIEQRILSALDCWTGYYSN